MMNIKDMPALGDEIDVSEHFYKLGSAYFNVNRMESFCPNTLKGNIGFTRSDRKGRMSFNAYSAPFEESVSWNFPPAYDNTPVWPIQFSFPSQNAVRIQTSFLQGNAHTESSLMLMFNGTMPCLDVSPVETENVITLQTPSMSVEIVKDPFSFRIKNADGKLLTKSLHSSDSMCLQNCNPLPLSYVRTNLDMKKYSAISFSIQPGEHFYGGGESFTALDKRGQKLVLWTKDPHGVETQNMYKPVPFYMSSRGYGIFAHTSAPVTLDFGHSYQESQTIFVGEGSLDIFIITGSPMEILETYTQITGRSPMPPIWSFGLWMSRITYRSEQETRETAKKLRLNQIPCDVIHLDTGWFEENWQCDYRFADSRFDDPEKMIQDLREEGFRISLWQLPYFTPKNKFFRQLIDEDLVIKDHQGNLPTEDAILDFSNPQAVAWYSKKIGELLKLGVSAIKADFGEAAPVEGVYYSGKPGLIEHNLYPLRYNQAVANITHGINHESIIWARSAWAGSQRFPVHWGGDAENTNMGMLASLRAGLSLGMCGFTFWSHDIGGFVRQSPEDLYERWAFMGIFTTHMRCHGAPPKEPWMYTDQFLQLFRKQMSFRYRITPYVLAQSIESAKHGYPVMRSMWFSFPEDQNCYGLEDQYMFGENILVAPLFEDKAEHRAVYLPHGTWRDLFSSQTLAGGSWHTIAAGPLRGIALIQEGAVLPIVDLSQSTDQINWDSLAYHWYTNDQQHITGTGIDIAAMTTFPITREHVTQTE